MSPGGRSEGEELNSVVTLIITMGTWLKFRGTAQTMLLSCPLKEGRLDHLSTNLHPTWLGAVPQGGDTPAGKSSALLDLGGSPETAAREIPRHAHDRGEPACR